jgi:hypothetical protein
MYTYVLYIYKAGHWLSEAHISARDRLHVRTAAVAQETSRFRGNSAFFDDKVLHSLPPFLPPSLPPSHLPSLPPTLRPSRFLSPVLSLSLSLSRSLSHTHTGTLTRDD